MGLQNNHGQDKDYEFCHLFHFYKAYHFLKHSWRCSGGRLYWSSHFSCRSNGDEDYLGLVFMCYSQILKRLCFEL